MQQSAPARTSAPCATHTGRSHRRAPARPDAGHRFKNSQSTLGSQHSEDTKLKIAASERATKYRLRRQRLASLAAAAAEAATADLRPAFDARHTGEALQRVFTGATGPHEDGGGSGSSSSSESDDSEEEAALLDMLGLEKAVIEMMSLRRQLGAWMTAQEERECCCRGPRAWLAARDAALLHGGLAAGAVLSVLTWVQGTGASPS